MDAILGTHTHRPRAQDIAAPEPPISDPDVKLARPVTERDTAVLDCKTPTSCVPGGDRAAPAALLGSLLAAEWRLVVLGGRLVILVVNER